MQRLSNKLFNVSLVISIICYSSIIYAKNSNPHNLILADSLFEKKQYVESYEIYEEIFLHKSYSPQMLTKMALIKEGLGDYTYALYYLNLYYSYIHDRSVLKKMDELASRYNLEGYDYNDIVFFVSLYQKYYKYVIISFLLASGFFLVYLFIKRIEKSKMGVRPLFYMLILGAVYVISNYDIIPSKAIVNKNAILMSAPSAGSELLGEINKGHRVTIRSKEDIWCKINWHGKTAYVRQNNLLFLENL